MKELEEKIRAFALNPERATFALALLKVGLEKGDKPEVIMSRVIAFILFDFHGIPFKPNG